ncbi:hypothetical protein J4466_00195 [Candidatus Pacearchaeota archaeon]|nr:hypothetical protein [Candidatus Pacearchaeota archaeon]
MATATQTKYEVNVDIVPSKLQSGIVYAPFDLAQAELESENYDIISLPVNVEQRMIQGKQHNVSTKGNYVREGVLYIPRKGTKLVRNSPILYSAEEATQAHRDIKEFYPSKEAIEKALADSVDFPLHNIGIPTNRFNEEALTIWAFGAGDSDKAQAYGNWLRNGEPEIMKMPVWAVDKDYVNKQNYPFARQLWFSRLDSRSVLNGGSRDLHSGDRVRGVREVSAEGASQKVSKTTETENVKKYTPQEIEEHKKIVEGVRTGELPASKLEEVLGLFSRL